MKLSILDIFWVALIVCLVAAATFLVFMVYLAFHNGMNFDGGINIPDKSVNILCVTSYMANSLVAIIACFSIVFVKTQIKHGEAVRIASIYMDLDKRYHEDGVQHSLRYIYSLRERFESEKAGEETLESFAHKHLAQLRQEHLASIGADPSNDTDYMKSIRFIMLLEYVGILVKRRYLREKDVFDLFGRDIRNAELITKTHIKWVREHNKDNRVLSNTITLMEMARR